MDIAYIVIGLLVGFIVGLTGIGGGSLMTPILVLGFSVPPAIAVGTDLLYAALTKSAGVFWHHARNTIDWKIVKLLCLGSVPSTFISVFVLKHIIATGLDYECMITMILSISLILTSLALFFKNRIHKFNQDECVTGGTLLSQRFISLLTVITGALIGSLVTFSSVGAGALVAAVLFFLYPRMPTVSIVATDIAHAVPITAIAGIGHIYLGTVNYILLGNLLIGSVPGIYLGGSFAYYLPEKIMRPILASILMIIGVCLIF